MTFEHAADIEGETPITAGEVLAGQFRAEVAIGDGKPEGTQESLRRTVKMLNTYARDCFPANDQGQVHFARAVMESAADEIAAFLVMVDETTERLDKLADLLADSEDLRIRETPAVQELNAILGNLA